MRASELGVSSFRLPIKEFYAECTHPSLLIDLLLISSFKCEHSGRNPHFLP